MTRASLLRAATACSIALLTTIAGAAAHTAAPQQQPTPQPRPQASHESNEGQRVFEQNCSRCHNTPDGFPPQIAGTVAHHMRVRANLSEHDYKELLRFLNP